MMKYLLTTTIFFFCLGHIIAQEDDQILVTELKQSTVITEPSTLHKGFFKLGAAYSYGVGDKIFTDEGKKEFIPENTWVKSIGYTLILQYGLTDRLELALQLPYSTRAMFYSSVMSIPLLQTSETTLFDIHGSGIGDLVSSISFQIIEGNKTKPSLVSSLIVEIPTGEKNPTNEKEDFSYDMPMGYGETTLQLELRYRKILFPYSYTLYGSMKYCFEGHKIMAPFEEEIAFKSGSKFYLGGMFNFLLNDWISIKNDLSFTYHLYDTYEDKSYETGENIWGVYYMPHLTFQLKRFRFSEGISIPLKGKLISADPMYVIMAQYIF